MNPKSKAKIERLLRGAAPLMKDLEGPVVPASPKVLAAFTQAVDQIYPVYKQLTAREMERVLLEVTKQSEMDGFEICARLEKSRIRLREQPKAGIYRILDDLEVRGLVKSRWATRGDREVKLYGMTEAGFNLLRTQEATEEVRAMSASVLAVPL